MSDSSSRPNSVSALRAQRRPRHPRLRGAVLATLTGIAIAAAVTFALATDRQVRAWAATVAVMSLLGAVIAWLVGKSSTLSSSDRDPQDFTFPPTTL